jgi:hypothetical protein
LRDPHDPADAFGRLKAGMLVRATIPAETPESKPKQTSQIVRRGTSPVPA